MPADKAEIPIDPFEQIGLKKEKISGRNVYTLEFDDKLPTDDTLGRLKELVKPQRVAVELGPGNQLDSLFFAARKSNADVVVGIDPNFDYPNFKKPEKPLTGKAPTVILFKGDGWGDQRIINFFGGYGDAKDKLAIYSQLVAPDSMFVEHMIGATIPLSKEGFLIILDSGAVELLKKSSYQPTDVHAILLKEAGVNDYSHLSWIKHWLRGVKQTTISKEDYQKGILEGKYPPSAFLRAGEMMVFEKEA